MGKYKGDQAKVAAASGKIETPAGQKGPPGAPSDSAQAAPEGTIASAPWDHAGRLTTLAASAAMVAAIGGIAGSLATAGPGALWSIGAVAQTASTDATPSHDWVASIDEQLVKLGNRFDRLEHAQADPAARLAKLSERVDRIEHGGSTADRDATGSIGTASPQAAPEHAHPPLAGWILKRVSNGTALIQSRAGAVEVVPGATVPAIGRVEAIRRQQDGRWVVLTSRGMIGGR